MRKVDRTTIPVPGSLSLKSAAQEYEKAKRAADLFLKRQNGKAVAEAVKVEFKIYKQPDIRTGLESLFYGKCAYCEARYAHQAPVEIEHFRPKGALEGEDPHPGYWWLAAKWENLVPSCIDCNRRRTQDLYGAMPSFAEWTDARITLPKPGQSGKAAAFPIAGIRAVKEADSLDDERAFFLNPTADDPDDHLDYYLDHVRDNVQPLAIVLPRILAAGSRDRLAGTPEGQPGPSARGMMTIRFFGLNRLALVQERTALLRRLEFLGDLLTKIDGVALDLKADIDTQPQALRYKLTGATKVLDGLINRILDELSDATDPSQPYSALATAWLKRWKASLSTPRDPQAVDPSSPQQPDVI